MIPSSPGDIVTLARAAAALEARGEWDAAVETWSKAHALDASRPDVRLGFAQSLIRANRVAEALGHLEALIAAPDAPAAAWLATGVACALLGRHGDAVRMCEQAAARAPNVADVHKGHGDVLYRAGDASGARLAYERARTLAPDDADLLNKLATVARIEKRKPEARALLEQALAHSRDHPYAQFNLATMALREGHVDEARHRFEATLATPALPASVRDAAAEALAMFDERDALASPVAEALARDDAAPIVRALGSRSRDLEVDAAIVDAVSRILDRATASPPADAGFAPLADRSGRRHALEAHSAYRFDGDRAALERDLRLVEGHEAPSDNVDDDVLRYARAAKSRHANRPPERAGDELDAWLRLAHARLLAHRAIYWPGFYKPTNATPRADPKEARAPALRVAGTMRAILAEIGARFPPGGWRATLLMLALLRVHPFINGNKRLAHYLANGELEAAGLMPHANAPGSLHELVTLVAQNRESGDPGPLAAWLAAGSRRAAQLDADCAERERR